MLKYKNKKRNFKNSEKGMALVETIPVLFMLVLIFNFSLGFFGAIHSGILNSIGSYNYAIETFRFKSNLVYFRPGGSITNYSLSKNRVHGVTKDGGEQDDVQDKTRWPATVRPITFNYSKTNPAKTLNTLAGSGETICDDNNCRTFDQVSQENVWKANSEYVPQTGATIQTPRIWIKTVYGICITADCK